MTNDHGVSARRIKRVHIHSPVTALAFLRLSQDDDAPLFILSGEDTNLQIRDAATSHLCATVQVFTSQPIQGISSAVNQAHIPDHILVWGGPWIAAVPRAKLVNLIQLLRSQSADHAAVPDLILTDADRLRAPDWIYHAALSPKHPDLAAVVTAHNEVLPLHIIDTPTQRLQWGAVRTPPSSRPILYAAQVRWLQLENGEEEVLVAAGTAFGEIVVWRCRVDVDADAVEVLYVFTGHEGSIFGVDISPTISGRGAGPEQRFLASCSDDRTIRIWDISSATTGNTRRPLVAAARTILNGGMPEARETGFGENTTSELEAHARHVASTPVAMAMGHVSRIWQARFALPSVSGSTGDGSMVVYSFGEDATAQKWRFELPGLSSGSLEGEVVQPGATLTHETVIHRHNGKNIWSSTVLDLNAPVRKTIVATGGSDGQISIVEEIPSPEEDERSIFLELSGSAVAKSITSCGIEKTIPNGDSVAEDLVTLQTLPKRKNGAEEDEPFLMYALLSATSIVASTATGRVFSGTLHASSVSWTEVPLTQIIQDDLQRYQVVRTAGPSTALFGSAGGHLYIYHRGSVSAVLKVPGKVADIFTLQVEDLPVLGYQSKETTSSLVPVVVSPMGSTQVRLLVLDPAKFDSIIQQEQAIDLEKGFTTTAVGRCQEYLILGSRSGALLLYKYTGKSPDEFERVLRVDRPRAKDGVSTIVPLPGKTKGTLSPYFLTTSRDGRYRIYEITHYTPGSTPEVHLRHEALPALGGPILESAQFTTNTSSPPELILTGFRGKNLIIWNETHQRVLATLETGGAHRSTTWRIDQTHPENLAIVWSRPSRRTCIFAQTARHGRVVKSGGHGREIKAVAAGLEGLIATGAEDTTIRIWRRRGVGEDGAGQRFKCLAVVERHTTGIQCLKWAGANYLVSSGGNEELYVWRITRFPQSAYEGLAVMCEGIYPDKTKDGDLRIMGFDVQISTPGSQGDEAEETLCLSLVLSNSTLKTYRYSKTAGFALLASARYTGACLLQVRHLHVGTSELHVLTASTDGHIALWKAYSETTIEYTLLETKPLHQSSIKALDLQALTSSSSSSPRSSSYTVHTGGDNNALGHVQLDWDDTARQFRVAARSLAKGAHAAAITGLCVRRVSPTSGGGYAVELVTVSNDQRVRSWRTRHETRRGTVKVALAADGCSGVADCGDLELLDGDGCGGRGDGSEALVVGVGMETWMV